MTTDPFSTYFQDRFELRLWYLIALSAALVAGFPHNGPCEVNMIYKDGGCICPRKAWNNETRMFHAYAAHLDKCYAVYTQGYCEPSSWIVIQSGTPACDYNPCSYKKDYHEGKYVLYKGFCSILNQGNILCSSGFIALSSKDGFTPECVEGVKGFTLSLGKVTPRPCDDGKERSSDGLCLEVVDF